MNQIQSHTVRLRSCMESSDGWGNRQGKAVCEKLRADVSTNANGCSVVRISLIGVERTDASFPRESVVYLARTLKGSLTFCIVDVDDEDLLDNWDAAANKLGQSLMCWGTNGECRVLGPQPSTGNEPIFKYLVSRTVVTASHAAKALDLKLANASMKLKQLLQQGLAVRIREAAPSGGVEFFYHRVQ